MLLDLTYQTMLAAPPRTWVQSLNHPGSRYWLSATLAAISQLLERPLPSPPGSARREGAIRHLGLTVQRTRSEGVWTQATSAQRGRLAEFVEASSVPFPVTVASIARSGSVPFSRREMARVRRREAPFT